MGVFSVIMMIVFVILMGSMRKLKNKSVANNLSLVFFALVVIFGIIAFRNFSDDGASSAMKNAQSFYVSQGDVLGEAIKAKFGKGKNILVVSLPDEAGRDHIKNMTDRLGKASDANKVKSEKVDVDTDNPEMPALSQVNTAVIDDVDIDDFDVVVFTFDVPLQALGNSQAAKKAENGKLGVYIVGVMDSAGVDGMIKRGAVTGATKLKDNISPKDEPKSKAKDTFNVRYTLLP